MSKHVLIIGGNSDIGFSCAKQFVDRGCRVTLVAHKPEEVSGWEGDVVHLDVTKAEAVNQLAEIDCDIVVYSAGKMAENDAALFSDEGDVVRDVNYNAPVKILGSIAKVFAARKSGVIVGISSVAADRGKSSNVIYGSAKGGFDHFLAGLRQYMHPHGVRVLTIRPGYVSTKMTEGMDLPGSLTSTKEKVAQKIVKHSLGGSRNIVYVSAIWRPLMCTLQHIPEWLFKRKQL